MEKEILYASDFDFVPFIATKQNFCLGLIKYRECGGSSKRRRSLRKVQAKTKLQHGVKKTNNTSRALMTQQGKFNAQSRTWTSNRKSMKRLKHTKGVWNLNVNS